MAPETQPSLAPAAAHKTAGCACADDESGAFLGWVGQLVHRHRGELAAVARAEGLNAEDAFDAVQDAFQTFITLPAAHPLVAPRRRRGVRLPSQKVAALPRFARDQLIDAGDESRKLLVTLTRNVARNRRRHHARAKPHLGDPALLAGLPAPAAGADEIIAAAQDQMRLHRCVQTLAEVQRAVVTLRMLDDVPGEDVATALGITPGHVAVLLHRAKHNLLACMTR
jgi:RNA polymerase sigma-70 factor (ECF subfamily)